MFHSHSKLLTNSMNHCGGSTRFTVLSLGYVAEGLWLSAHARVQLRVPANLRVDDDKNGLLINHMAHYHICVIVMTCKPR